MTVNDEPGQSEMIDFSFKKYNKTFPILLINGLNTSLRKAIFAISEYLVFN